jgi:hypothetical protein
MYLKLLNFVFVVIAHSVLHIVDLSRPIRFIRDTHDKTYKTRCVKYSMTWCSDLEKLENDALKNWKTLDEDLKKKYVERAKYEWRAVYGTQIYLLKFFN